jgi:hypothetical protein
VNKALSAYKFDHLGRGNPNDARRYLSTKEEWFVTQNLDKLARKILHKRHLETLDEKAARWEHKIGKYHEKREYMLISYTLHVLSQFLAGQGDFIRKAKSLSPATIEGYAAQLRALPQNVQDAILRWLENPAIDLPHVPFRQAVTGLGVEIIDQLPNMPAYVKEGIKRELRAHPGEFNFNRMAAAVIEASSLPPSIRTTAVESMQNPSQRSYATAALKVAYRAPIDAIKWCGRAIGGAIWARIPAMGF